MITLHDLRIEDFASVKSFADEQIGIDYFSTEDLQKIYDQSHTSKGSCSLVAKDGDKIVAIRLTRGVGSKWFDSKKTRSDLWKVDKGQVAYFQSLFVHPNYQSRGLAVKMSSIVIQRLREAGCKAIVAHSLVESKGNSSFNYLTKMGFTSVQLFPNYWAHIDYHCSDCKCNPCKCSALEMILYL